MSKSVKSFFALLLVLQLVIPYPAFAAMIGQFFQVSGNVTQTREGRTYRAVVRSPVEVNDVIMTGDNSTASIVFADESTIKIEANSRLVVKDFTLVGETRKSTLSLVMGKVTAKVKKFIGGNNTFEVHSPTAIASVKGTIFTVAAETIADVPTTTITCLEGSLSVNALSATREVVSTSIVTAGQTATITSSGATIAGTPGAAGAVAAADKAGAAAGTGAKTGLSAGTIAIGAVIAAAAVGALLAASGGSSSSNH